ncbi:hypothetical protein D3C84_1229290 [compost metagenome]
MALLIKNQAAAGSEGGEGGHWVLRTGEESLGSMALDPVMKTLIAYLLVGRPTSMFATCP